MKTITMIDYGLCNLRSVQKAIEHVGAQAILTQEPSEVRRAEKLVLPGVGAFGAGMEGLQQRGLVEAIQAAVEAGVPIFGICLGMQLLFDSSNEMGEYQGLGLIAGRVERFHDHGLRVPHLGWNQIEFAHEHPLLRAVQPGDYAYFAHSYVCHPLDPATIVATTDYGGAFASVVAKQKVFGIQFHPEKSQTTGLTMLKNFAEL